MKDKQFFSIFCISFLTLGMILALGQASADPVEICDNGVDDNLDGLVDCEDPGCDGFIDGDCDTGLPGICAAGSFVCQTPEQICMQQQTAGQEGPAGDITCIDGLDNDCDGLTDDDDFDSCEPANRPPTCNDASPSIVTLWPPNHRFIDIQVLGVTDPDGDPVTITITSIFQDEPVDKPFAPDGIGVGTSIAQARAERDGRVNGRVYHITFTADDEFGGTCDGIVMVSVPRDQNGAPAVDDGALYDSTIVP